MTSAPWLNVCFPWWEYFLDKYIPGPSRNAQQNVEGELPFWLWPSVVRLDCDFTQSSSREEPPTWLETTQSHQSFSSTSQPLSEVTLPLHPSAWRANWSDVILSHRSVPPGSLHYNGNHWRRARHRTLWCCQRPPKLSYALSLSHTHTHTLVWAAPTVR